MGPVWFVFHLLSISHLLFNYEHLLFVYEDGRVVSDVMEQPEYN